MEVELSKLEFPSSHSPRPLHRRVALSHRNSRRKVSIGWSQSGLRSASAREADSPSLLISRVGVDRLPIPYASRAFSRRFGRARRIGCGVAHGLFSFPAIYPAGALVADRAAPATTQIRTASRRLCCSQVCRSCLLSKCGCEWSQFLCAPLIFQRRIYDRCLQWWSRGSRLAGKMIKPTVWREELETSLIRSPSSSRSPLSS